MRPTKAGRLSAFLILVVLSIQCGPGEKESVHVSSPDGRITVTFTLDQGGVPTYQVRRGDQDIIKPSKLGFSFKDAPPLTRNLAMVGLDSTTHDETWTQPWGEVKDIRNHFTELRIRLQETSEVPRRLNIVFRVYDDGLGFRYEVPEQDHLQTVQIMDEHTEFNLAGNHKAWWIKAYQWNRYEYLYRSSRVSRIDVVHTPLTMETADGLFLSIHEAGLTDYSSMSLERRARTKLTCDLAPWSDGTKVKTQVPFVSPWRTIQIAETAGDLITSYLILNLNEPNKLGDVSWVKPGKYVGIWWGMHIGKYTWGSGPKHGATTENVKRYIDFAAKYGFSGVLVEGWNRGWDGNWVENRDLFDFTTPYDDFDIEELSRYAASKGVKIIGHHETSAGIGNYERQVDDAFRFYRRLGINTVKTGYVGHGQNIVPVGDTTGAKEWHYGQYMVRHYRKTVKKAAQHNIMLDVHEPIKPTGIRRTYPNMMTREGARGQEYNAWSQDGGNPPEHTTILPFTRLLGGPMDFTPGIFDLTFEEANRPDNRVSTTLAKQLALYVVIYSPLQMAADLPENYENQPAFQFIVDVPVDWEETQVLHGQIGDFVTIARKDRNSDDWYVGSITDEHPRSLQAPLSFLDSGRKYVAEIYRDGADAHWETNPLAVDISSSLVDRNTTLDLVLASGGGQAIRLRPATQKDVDTLLAVPPPLPLFEENRDSLPRPILESHPDWIDMYWKSWEIAFKGFKQPPRGSPFVSNWLDEAFSPNIFQWDTIFMIMFARYGHDVFPVIQSLDNFYALQRESGYISREIREMDGKFIHFADGDLFHPMGWKNTINPPLFSWAEVESFKITGDKSRFEKVLPVLERYAEWLDRDGDPDALDWEANGRRSVASVHKLYWNTPLGSGMDNTPRPAEKGSGWVEMSAQMVIMYNNLAIMADELGQSERANHYRERAAQIGERVNRWSWNEEDGLYYDVLADGTEFKKKTAGSFWPLLAGIPTRNQAERLVQHLKNPDEFWRPMVFPTLSADEKEYRPDGGYWLGGVWAPTNVMLIKGLERYGYEDFATEATERYLSGMAQVFEETGTVWENYAPESFRPGNPAKGDFVGWTGCGPIALLIENVLGLRTDGVRRHLTWHLKRIDKHGIENLKVADVKVSVICEKRDSLDSPAGLRVTCDKPLTLTVIHPSGDQTFTLGEGEHVLTVPTGG